MATIRLNATTPPPPDGGARNVHFRQESGHAGTKDDPIPTSAYLEKLPMKTIGLTIDGTQAPDVPLARNVQVGYAGTIVGWSISNCDAVGSITVEIDKHASSAPPAPPAIPNTTTDKISAGSPIAMSSAQSASGDAASVASWTTRDVVQWDVIQFYMTVASGITRATIELYIQPS